MKPACAICGRLTVPAAYIGAEPIGPTCARKAGLLGLQRRGGRVRLASDPPPVPPPEQLDLFAEPNP